MVYRTSDTIMGPSRLNAEKVIAWMVAKGAPVEKTTLDINSIKKYAPKYGVRAEVAVAQQLVEATRVSDGAPLMSSWAQERNNFGGIGITGDEGQDNASKYFKDAEDFVLAQMDHLYLYAEGKDLPTAVATYQKNDPRWDDAVKAGYAGVAPTIAGLSARWAVAPTYGPQIVAYLNAMDSAGLLDADIPVEPDTEAVIGTLKEILGGIVNQTTPPTPATHAVTKIVFKRVPMFGYADRQFVTANKAEGDGWDNLGQRDVLGIVLHRMLGSLTGTDQFFGQAGVGALTDYGMGVKETDGDLAGYIYQWNNPYGYRSGWASGRVSAPYGDGLLFVNKYGVNAVNKRLVSIETSGFENTPIDDFAWGELVHFVAWWADQKGITWEQFPLNPATGISFLFWHQEMTIGTGKKCPFDVLMSRTNELIGDVQAFMKKYQVVAEEVIPPVVLTPPPVVVPTPIYATPYPITGLAMLAENDIKGHKGYSNVEGTTFRLVNDSVTVVDPTNFYQQTSTKTAPITKANPKVGDTVNVNYSFTSAATQSEFYLDDQWARIEADKVVLSSDVPVTEKAA